jgi:hypothetical protein
MTDDPEKAELRKKLAQAERRLRATQAEMAEIKQRVANFEKAEAALMKFYVRDRAQKRSPADQAFGKARAALPSLSRSRKLRKNVSAKLRPPSE